MSFALTGVALFQHNRAATKEQTRQETRPDKTGQGRVDLAPLAAEFLSQTWLAYHGQRDRGSQIDDNIRPKRLGKKARTNTKIN